jgi:RimJ/RimL family protein N-acetyltransferase
MTSMTTLIEIPTLRTPRLVLRAFRASDLDGLAAMNADPDVQHFLYAGRALTRGECWIQMAAAIGQWGLRNYGLFAVEADGRFAGRVGVLHPLEWPEPELAYALDAPFRGQGLATEAVTAVRDWAFARFGFARMASFILPANARSARVAARLGAVKEGTIELRGFVADWWVHRPAGAGVVV